MYILRCISCKKEFPVNKMHYTCPVCGDLKGTLDIEYDFASISVQDKAQLQNKTGPDSILRYTPILPVKNNKMFPSLKIGMTPLYSSPVLAGKMKIAELWIKDDSQNPSLSAKDRASAVSVAAGLEMGFDTFSTASTGNAAASLACICANMNLRCVIFVPETIPEAKLIQLQIYGAKIVLVRGSYDDAFDLCRIVSEENSWYNRSTAINPFNLEGKKTAAMEICQQLAFNVPDYVFVPVGDGCIISGIWKGFRDFYQLGLIDRLPKLVACQSEGSAAIAQAWQLGKTIPEPVKAKTIADSISVDLPRDGVKALRALYESNGLALTVRDDQIIASIPELARLSGLFVEPSSATAYACATKFFKRQARNEIRAVLLLTGSGLKDLRAARQSVFEETSIHVDPGDRSIARKLKELIH